jgi:hypothetical protein
LTVGAVACEKARLMKIACRGLWILLAAGSLLADEPARLPEVVVTGTQLQEEQPVGPYQQPAWTTARRFSTTRVYVQQPPWGMGVEQWWRGQFYRDGESAHRFQEELEIGLPHRLQLDIYWDWIVNKAHQTHYLDTAVELRWAVADWGKIPLNPTLYGEWKFTDANQGPDKFEVKLLLGEEIVPRWHWGLNLVYEQEVGGDRAIEWAVSQGLSYTVWDEKLSVGAELKFTHETEAGNRSDGKFVLLLGPSVQWRPCRNTHVDVVPLCGVTGHAPRVEAFVVIGIDFGPGHDRVATAPVSTRSQ